MDKPGHISYKKNPHKLTRKRTVLEKKEDEVPLIFNQKYNKTKQNTY